MTIIYFPLETSPSNFTTLSGNSLEGNFSPPTQAAPASTFVTNFNVRNNYQSINVPVTIPSFIDVISVDKESCGPCFPININRAYNILEPLGVTTFYGEFPRHQIFLNIPTIYNVRDDENYLFTAPVTTTVLPPFWS